MSDLRELYQEVIIDHAKRPRNFRKMENATRTVVGHNPLCGDRLTLFLRLEGDRVADVCFEGAGCAISTSSASLMTESLKGKSLPEAEALIGRFHAMVTGQPQDESVELGKLAVFAGVSEYPSRVKCASLAWLTVRSGLKDDGETVSTE